MERDQRRDAADLVLVERAQHARGRGLAVDVPHDQLGDHRVVHRGDLGARLDAGVDPHARARRLAVGGDPPRGGGELLVRRLRVDAALDRVAAQLDVVLGERERLAGRDPDLLAHDVDAGRHLGDRVLRPARGCSSRGRSTRACRPHPGRAGPRSSRRSGIRSPRRRRSRSSRSARGTPRRRRAPGVSSISFWWRRWTEQSRSPRWTTVALPVGEHLDLDVARVLEVALQVHGGVGEELLALAGRPSSASSSSSSVIATRKPFPPPPPAAFTAIG